MVRFTDKQRKVIDVLQWILIFALMVVCLAVFIGNKNLKKERELKKQETYMKIYDSQRIAKLEKRNKALYDSLMKVSDKSPEIAVEVRYKYKYKTDTVKVTEFTVGEDSIYHYSSDNDTVKTNIEIKANDLKWCNVDATINDKFMIINRTDGNKNELSVSSSDNTDITGVDVWHRKITWKDKITYGPSVSVGYNPITGKPEFLLGVSVGFDLRKRK